MEIDHWLERIDRTTEQVEDKFGKLSGARLNWKPNSETWSVAQCLDHMMVVNGTMFPAFDSLADGSYRGSFFTKIPGLAGFFGGFILKSQDPANRNKSKTMGLWQPSASEIDGDVVVRFAQHQDALKERYRTLEKKVMGNPVISSPAASFIVYRVEDAMELLVRHEERHLLQAVEVAGQIPASSSQSA